MNSCNYFENCISRIGIKSKYIIPIGHNKAKIDIAALSEKTKNPPGKLILVSAITPTPSGEGKTTVSIGLAQGLKTIGEKTCLALRQPSMGPVFGRKGGAAGGGKSTLIPSEDINIHFTGDFHAITAAHNLISAIIDNALYFRTIDLDERKVTWKRIIDMNDRALRSIIVGLNKQGFPRESSFDITPASEIMACLCLAESLEDMKNRVARIIVGFTKDDHPVFVNDLGITGAVIAILKDAMQPNLVQSAEGVPCFLHGGPFANIAHGCNSVLATRMAMKYSDYAVTECGFAFDLGAEKFLHIKCRQAGLAPDAIVIVATARALKMHGGISLDNLSTINTNALEKGLENLDAHLDAAALFNKPVVVAINKFSNDNDAELSVIQQFCKKRNIPCAVADIFAQGGQGGVELAQLVVKASNQASPPLAPLYENSEPVVDKISAIAKNIYGANGIELTKAAQKKLALFEKCKLTNLPICMAKTQTSLSDTPNLLGRPKDFTVTVRDFEIANGAGFLVALCGEIMRMPALPKTPNAMKIDIDQEGKITGI